jgi:clan AA aspartic protease
VIHGTVVGLQARIDVVFRLVGHTDVEMECVVDTGFEGFLTLPLAIVADFELPYLAEISANLANDSSVITDVYLATIVWGGLERNVAVLAMGRRPLVGTALLEDLHLSIDFCEGGTVLIDDIL